MKKMINTLKKINNNNKGVTLVELIVAVAVLSISIGPLLYTFVFSTRFNADSKVKQRSTTAAQTVMENLKATDMEDVNKMFKGVTVDNGDGTTSVTFPDQFIRNGDAMGVGYKFTSAGLADEELGTYEVLGMSLSDVTSKDMGKYDAVITVTAGLTNDNMPEVPVYDPRQDALWQETNENFGSEYYDPYFVATDAVRTKISNAGLDVTEVKRIDISRDMYAIFNTGDAYVQYKYPYSIFMADGSVYSGTIEYAAMPMVTSEFSMDLRNIYYYYYPAYKDTYSMVSNGEGGLVSSTNVNVTADNLYISNTSSGDINFFVYKQQNSVKSFFKLKTSENNYKLNCKSAGSSNTTKIYDCVQANLADLKTDYSATMSSMLYRPIDPESGNIALQSKVGSIDTTIMSYNVNIKIYKSGDRSKVLSEMNGTVLK